MYIAKGERVKIFQLTLADVHQMRNWGRHKNLLFEDYNFPQLDDDEIKEWYKIKTSKRSKKCFSIHNEEDKVIGYLTMKDIKKIKKVATLGIVFDPSYINRGYGTEAIEVFLTYFFHELNMKVMRLHVAKHNKRAIRCYEKCGFRVIRMYREKLDNQKIAIFDDPSYNGIREDFVSNKGILYSYFYEMEIEKGRQN